MADRNRLSVPQIRIIIDDVEQRHDVNDNDYDDDGDRHGRRRTINGFCDSYDEDNNRDWNRQYQHDNYEDEDNITEVDPGQRFDIIYWFGHNVVLSFLYLFW